LLTWKRPLLGAAATYLIGLTALVSPVPGQEAGCLDCHEDPGDVLAASVHEFAECIDCHPGAEAEDHMDGGLTPGCADCHDETAGVLENSVHGRAGGAAEWASGGCQVCHGSIHELVPHTERASPIHLTRIADTCGVCHADPDLAIELGIRLVQPLAAYAASVHAGAVIEGNGGANCSSCHGAHDILPAGDASSKVHRERVPETCGRCHERITEVFEASVHGKAARHGIQESPVCTDCHGEHRILGPADEESPVFATNLPKVTCGRCHGDLRLSAKFGLPEDKVPAYADSFHGLAARGGSVTVANCASCHGVHDILPSSDPTAHTHAANLAETCGNCHPGAGTQFAIGPVHFLPTEKDYPVVYWVRMAYLALIFGTIGAMLLHNLLDLFRKARHPEPRLEMKRAEMPERMSMGFRIAHALLAVSFIVLAYTGFALKYPEGWWSLSLFGLRGWIHRIAAVTMLAAAAVHIVHLFRDRLARRCIAEMWPGRADWVELRERISFLIGRRSTPPPEPWVGYVEKAEYLAVIWGTIIMMVTGFLLWFDQWTLRWLPSWVVDLSTVVHFYEAILATLAILVWHFYSVIFDPAVYPMDAAWLNGRSTRDRTPPKVSARKKTPISEV
jgi:cytochrome b subunit of formate dehydrogenase